MLQLERGCKFDLSRMMGFDLPGMLRDSATMLFKFDNYTLDVGERVLKRHDKTVALTPKVFDTLLFLVKNHDRVVSKDELLRAIWPGHFVEESNLTQNVSVLRRALGESASGKKYIATFSGRGYRFVEQVTAVEPEAAAAERSGRILRNSTTAPLTETHGAHPAALQRLAVIATCGLLMLAASVFILLGIRKGRSSTRLPAESAASLQIGAIRTMVRMAGAQYQPNWSRDGRQLAFAYSAPDGAQSAIYMQTLEQMHPRRITAGPGEFTSPVFSPNGRSLAFLRLRPNSAEILIYDTESGKTRKLVSLLPHQYGLSCRQLDWSPSGNFLVVDDKDSPSDPLSLYLVFLSNGAKVRLTYPDMDILGDTAPRFSPDGKQVLFIRMKYQYEYDVFVVPVTGGAQRRLTAEPGILSDVDWADNTRVLYSEDRDGEFRMWQLDVQSPRPQAVPLSTLATDMPLQFSISPKMGKIAFAGYRPDLNIWSYALSTSTPSSLRWKPVIRTPGQDITPIFSPDGTAIAFRSDVSGKFQIWVSRADGSNAIPVSTGSLFPSVISWAPDSRSIVFSSSTAPGIYKVLLAANSPLQKLSDARISHPLYSVDGKWIFGDSGGFLYRVPAAGGAPELLTFQAGDPIRQSADGRYLFFSHQRMDTTISRFDLVTRQQEVVVRSLIPGYHDAWALMNDGIVFLTEQGGKPVIAFHDLKTGATRVVCAFPGPLPMIATSGFSVSPDGKTLLVVRADPASADIRTASLTSSQQYTLASDQR